jgi:hypothetical protein
MSIEHDPIRDGKNDSRLARPPPNSPHLTRDELADRWRVKPQWVTKNYVRIGLRPMRAGKRLLFSLAQVEAHERREFGEVA